MKNIFLLFYCIIQANFLYSQNKYFIYNHKDIYAKHWDRTNKLIEQSKFRTANAIIDSIYKSAKAKNEPLMMLKAQLFKLHLVHDTSESVFEDLITFSEQHIKEEKFPFNAIWQSITAQMYWIYYQNNRDLILERNSIPRDIKIEDFELWDVNRFYDKIASLYFKSIFHADELKNINIKSFEPILVEKISSLECQTSLFDVLAYRALDFFEIEDNDLTKPLNEFKIDDPDVFAPEAAFVSKKFPTNDLTSYKWLAIQWYKQLLLEHENDSLKDELIDIDIRRLQYMFKTSQLLNKKLLYTEALQFIANEYTENPKSSLATYKIAECLADTIKNDWQTEASNKKTEKLQPQVNYNVILNLLNTVISKYPNSEGGKNAKDLKLKIEKPEFRFELEKTILPLEFSRILLTYRNLSKIYLNIIPLTNSEYRKMSNNEQPILARNTLKKTPIQSFQIELPQLNDYLVHRTEIKFDPLEKGAYAIILSIKDNFNSDSNIIQTNVFQVSELCLLTEAENNITVSEYILNRKTGRPISKAIIAKYKTVDNKSILERTKSQSEGTFSFRKHKSNVVKGFYNITFNKDTLWEPFNKYMPLVQNITTGKTYFFSDRSSYQPGDYVFLKGIVVKRIKRNSEFKVASYIKSNLILSDAFGNKLKAIDLQTNEFGSFSWKFQIPINEPEGTLKISNESGEIDINIQNVKGQLFEISTGKPGSVVPLNKTISLKGSLIDHLGTNLEGLSVKYRITRTSEILKNSKLLIDNNFNCNEIEIDKGNIKTEKEGKFQINFHSSADPQIDSTEFPIFTFRIYIEATNTDGEKCYKELSVKSSSTNIHIFDYIPEVTQPEFLDTLIIKTLFTDGFFAESRLHLNIYKMETPTKPMRKRLWDKPDIYLMDSISFKKYFPLDEYNKESDAKFWEIRNCLLDTFYNTNENGLICIPSGIWDENGWYCIKMNLGDSSKNKHNICKYIQVLNKNNIAKTSEPLTIIETNTYAEPTEEAEVTVYTNLDTCVMIEKELKIEGNANRYLTELGKSPYTWKKKIDESDRGGISLSFTILKDNRLYNKNVIIHVPWTNKQIDLKCENQITKVQDSSKSIIKYKASTSVQSKLNSEILTYFTNNETEGTEFNSHGIFDIYPNINAKTKWDYQNIYLKSSNLYDFTAKQKYFLPNIPHRLILIENNFHANNQFNNKYRNNYLTNSNSYLLLKNNENKIKGQSKPENKNLYSNLVYSDYSLHESIKNSLKSKDSVLFNTNLSKLHIRDRYFRKVKDYTSNQRTDSTIFLPFLRQDTSNNFNVIAKLPTNNQEWKYYALAHTEDLSIGFTEGKYSNNSFIDISSNLPGYLFQSDSIKVTTTLLNKLYSNETAQFSVHLWDAVTKEIIDSSCILSINDTSFFVFDSARSFIKWSFKVPTKQINPILIKTYFRCNNYADSQLKEIPIFTIHNFKIINQPLLITGNGSKNYSFNKLLNIDSNLTEFPIDLTVQNLSSIGWYSVIGLSQNQNMHESNSLQTIANYFQSIIALKLINESPKFSGLLSKWSKQLFENDEFWEEKSSFNGKAVKEVPWLNDRNENEIMKQNICKYFDIPKLEHQKKTSLNIIRDLQLASGGIPWFKGMPADRNVSQYFVEYLGKLKNYDDPNKSEISTTVLKKLLDFLDRQVKIEYQNLISNKTDLNSFQISNEDVHYLYVRKLFKEYPIAKNALPAFNYIQRQAIDFRFNFNPYFQSMIALTLYHDSDIKTSKEILNEIKSVLISDNNGGKFFKNEYENYNFFDAPIEQQSQIMNCISEISHDSILIDSMKTWIIEQKSGNKWEGEKNNLAACYALLLNTPPLQFRISNLNVNVGGKPLITANNKNSRKMGIFNYQKQTAQFNTNSGNISISTQDNEHKAIFNNIMYRYIDLLDSGIKPNLPFNIQRTLYKIANSNSIQGLQKISAADTLKKGDKVVMKVEVNAYQNMNYMQIKNIFSACFQPKFQFEGNRNKGLLNYYEQVNDNSATYFFSHLNKGKYVFENSFIVTQSGSFSLGKASINCIFAPEASLSAEKQIIFVE